MIRSKVRCWKFNEFDKKIPLPHRLYLTAPNICSGHNLITCTRCGHIYSVSILKMVYLGPELSEKLKHVECLGCGTSLVDNYASYPDNYLLHGKLMQFKRPSQILRDEDALELEFDEIYS